MLFTPLIAQKQPLTGRPRVVIGSLPLAASAQDITRYVFGQLTGKEEKACDRATD